MLERPAESARDPYDVFRAGSDQLRVLRTASNALGVVFLFALLSFVTRGVSWMTVVGCWTIPLIFAIGLWVDRRMARLSQECYASLQRMRFAVCPGCEYNLRSLADPMQCPECGKSVGEEQNHAAWYAKYRKLYGPGAIRRIVAVPRPEASDRGDQAPSQAVP